MRGPPRVPPMVEAQQLACVTGKQKARKRFVASFAREKGRSPSLSPIPHSNSDDRLWGFSRSKMQVRRADPSSWKSKAWDTNVQSLVYSDTIPWRSNTRTPDTRCSLGIHSITRCRSRFAGVENASGASSGFSASPLEPKQPLPDPLRWSVFRGTRRATGLSNGSVGGRSRNAPLCTYPHDRGPNNGIGYKKVNRKLKIR